MNENRYLEEQARAGVAQSLISPIPQLFLYEFEKQITWEASTVYNNALRRMAESSSSFAGLATLPLNAPVLAAAELSRAWELD